MEEIIDKLKKAKVDKQKKWLYNFAARVIKLYEEEKDIIEFQKSITTYYKQHYEDYFSKKYEERVKNGKYKKSNYAKHTEKLTQKELQREYRRIYQLYKYGRLSKHSTKIIEEE